MKQMMLLALSLPALAAFGGTTNVVLRDRWLATFCNMASDEVAR